MWFNTDRKTGIFYNDYHFKYALIMIACCFTEQGSHLEDLQNVTLTGILAHKNRTSIKKPSMVFLLIANPNDCHPNQNDTSVVYIITQTFALVQFVTRECRRSRNW